MPGQPTKGKEGRTWQVWINAAKTAGGFGSTLVGILELAGRGTLLKLSTVNGGWPNGERANSRPKWRLAVTWSPPECPSVSTSVTG